LIRIKTEKTKVPTGTVKFYKDDKGYGFITPDGADLDIFVHINNCAESIDVLEKGQRVRFEERISTRSGKPEAYDVDVVA
jgi:cold shock protein